MRKTIAYCGLDCEKCDAYIATVNDDQELRKKTAELWSQMNHAEILPDMINCEGCRFDGMKTVFCDRICQIRQCATKKGVATCTDCEEMQGCEKLSAITANNPEALNNLRKEMR